MDKFSKVKVAYHNRGKIIISDKAIDDDRLNFEGYENVRAGKQVRVFKMTIRFI